MKKGLLSGLFLICIISLSLAQSSKRDASKLSSPIFPGISLVGLNGVCDSIGWPFALTDSIRNYTIGGDDGYLAGTNRYDDLAKGNYFDLSGNTASYITRAIVGIGNLNGASGGNLAKAVNVKVLDGSSGTPGSVLGSFDSNIGDMRSRAQNFTIVTFTPAIPIPFQRKVFLIIEFPTLSWNTSSNITTKDTLSMFTTSVYSTTANLAWEQWSDASWHTFSSSWLLPSMNVHMYPLVSATADGCNTLPVTFGEFEGKAMPRGTDLTWTTWTEKDNQYFEVERSDDALKYVSLGRVATKAVNGNSQGLKNYAFTDLNPIPGVNFYRIRQVDKDGASDFSKTIKISYSADLENAVIRNYYPNPATDRLIIQLGAGIREVQALRFSDASGKISSSQKPAVAPDGTMNVSISKLSSGLHFATVILPDGQQSTIKVIKE